MKVRELIQHLSKEDMDDEVVIAAESQYYNGGVTVQGIQTDITFPAKVLIVAETDLTHKSEWFERYRLQLTEETAKRDLAIDQWQFAATEAKRQRDVIIDEGVEKTGRILQLEAILSDLCEIRRRNETSDPDLQPNEAFEDECWQKAMALGLISESQKPEVIQ